MAKLCAIREELKQGSKEQTNLVPLLDEAASLWTTFDPNDCLKESTLEIDTESYQADFQGNKPNSATESLDEFVMDDKSTGENSTLTLDDPNNTENILRSFDSVLQSAVEASRVSDDEKPDSVDQVTKEDATIKMTEFGCKEDNSNVGEITSTADDSDLTNQERARLIGIGFRMGLKAIELTTAERPKLIDMGNGFGFGRQ